MHKHIHTSFYVLLTHYVYILHTWNATTSAHYPLRKTRARGLNFQATNERTILNSASTPIFTFPRTCHYYLLNVGLRCLPHDYAPSVQTYAKYFRTHLPAPPQRQVPRTNWRRSVVVIVTFFYIIVTMCRKHPSSCILTHLYATACMRMCAFVRK